MNGGTTMRYVKGDPYWITVRREQLCDACGTWIAKGDRGFWWPKGRRLECMICGESSSARFWSEVTDEITAGGW